MALPLPPNQFAEVEIEAKGGESSAPDHQQEVTELGLDLGYLTSSFVFFARAEPPELEAKRLNTTDTALCPSLHKVTATVPLPLPHNVTINVAELTGLGGLLYHKCYSVKHFKDLEVLDQVSPLYLEKLRPTWEKGLSKLMSPGEAALTP
jgi:hypothetical protein